MEPPPGSASTDEVLADLHERPVSIHLDTSAMAKLLIAEPETTAVRSWLWQQTNWHLLTNTVGVVELGV